MILDRDNFNKSSKQGSECPLWKRCAWLVASFGSISRKVRFCQLALQVMGLRRCGGLDWFGQIDVEGMNNNKELMSRVTTPTVVKLHAEDFEDLWSKAEPIASEYCESQITAWRKLPEIKEEKRLEKRRSRSASLPRGSSTQSLEAVTE